MMSMILSHLVPVLRCGSRIEIYCLVPSEI